MSEVNWQDLHPEWAPVIAGIARQTAGRVMHLRGDLYQVGWEILLDRTDPDSHRCVPVTERELLVRILHDGMKDYRTLWLSGNTSRHPRSRGIKVITTPADDMQRNEATRDNMLRDALARRGVQDAREARGPAVRQFLPERTLALLDKKARGEKLSNAESQNISKGRRILAGKIRATFPPVTCAECDGHPEYMDESGTWHCYLHKASPVVLWNHPTERTVWTPEKHDTQAPAWRKYERRTPRPQHSDEYKTWLAAFRAQPKEAQDDEVRRWTRRRR